MIPILLVDANCSKCKSKISKCRYLADRFHNQYQNIQVINLNTFFMKAEHQQLLQTFTKAFGNGWLYLPALIISENIIIMGIINIMRELTGRHE